MVLVEYWYRKGMGDAEGSRLRLLGIEKVRQISKRARAVKCATDGMGWGVGGAVALIEAM